MDFDSLITVVIVAFIVIAIVDIYFDVLCHGLGRRLLLSLSSGRFPPTQPSRLQRLLTSGAGFAAITAVLLAILFVRKLMV